MTSDILIDDEDEHAFRSPFDLGFDFGALETFKWLIVGHLLYVIGLGIALYARLDMAAIWVTPLFGLPLLWADRKNRPLIKALVLILLFPIAHYLAMRLASLNFHDEATLVPGAIAGAAGAAAALLACAVFGLLRPGVPTIVFALFGIVLLAATGAIGVYQYLMTGSPDASVAQKLVRLLWIYTPWQLVFGYVLSKALKPRQR